VRESPLTRADRERQAPKSRLALSAFDSRLSVLPDDRRLTTDDISAFANDQRRFFDSRRP